MPNTIQPSDARPLGDPSGLGPTDHDESAQEHIHQPHHHSGAEGERATDANLARARMLNELSPQPNVKQLPAPSLKQIQDGSAKLEPGQAGPAVTQIQKMLNMPQTGVYDAATQTAVKQFQQDHGLNNSTSSEVNQQTLQALEHPNHHPPAPSLGDIQDGSAKLQPGEKGPAVAQIQKMLNMPQTGIYDGATQKAVKQFQEDHGLHSNTNEVGRQTLDALEHPQHPPAPSLHDIQDGSAKLQAGEQGPAVSELQKMMNMPQTGIYDAATQKAVKQFQAQHGLHSNSNEVGAQTLHAMERAKHHPLPQTQEGPMEEVGKALGRAMGPGAFDDHHEHHPLDKNAAPPPAENQNPILEELLKAARNLGK